jgi:predicted CXXCH cytochrome family protein
VEEAQMKIARLLRTVIITLALLVLAVNGFGLEVSIGPAEITLQTESARKPADFPHRQHQEAYSCTACHHVKEGIMIIEKCVSCHTPDISNPDVNSYKKAAHKLCKDCHKTLNSEEGRDAPIKCSGCHIKRE